MKRLSAVLLLGLAFFAGCVQAQSAVPGSIVVQKAAGAWVVYKADGTQLNTAGSTTFGIQEAMNHWGVSQNTLRILCGGPGDPFTFPAGTTITIPRSVASIEARGCRFFFSNFNGAAGFAVDTQQTNRLDFGGSQTYYAGYGSAWLLQPKAILQNVVWSLNSEFDLGWITAIGGSPILLTVDVTQTVGPDQPRSSQFVVNQVTARLQGGGFAPFNFRHLSPVSVHQVGGENVFNFPQNEGSLYGEIYIGTYTGNGLDQNLGTNKYVGNLAHTTTPVGGHNIITNAPWDYYDLRSMNIYNPGPTHNVLFGPQACLNVIRTTQILAGSAGVVENHCAANNNVIGTP